MLQSCDVVISYVYDHMMWSLYTFMSQYTFRMCCCVYCDIHVRVRGWVYRLIWFLFLFFVFFFSYTSRFIHIRNYMFMYILV